MSKYIILLISLSCLAPAGSIAAYYEESSLGKLFSTPVQRQKIDAFRKGKSMGVAREQISPTDIKVQGIVKRSDGASTVWINGKSTLDSNYVGGVNVRLNSISDSSGKVTVGIKDKAVRLKPGQVWSEDTGRISDGY